MKGQVTILTKLNDKMGSDLKCIYILLDFN